MSEIVMNQLSGTHDYSHRTVRIQSDYEHPGQLNELYAFLSPQEAKLTSIFDDTEPKSFRLSAEDMDALTSAWTQFRADCEKARDDEEKRLQSALRQAYKLAAECSAIKIEKETDDYYNREYQEVTCTGIQFSTAAYDPDQLLEAVTTAHNLYLEHCKNIEAAKTIAKEHPEIHIKSTNHGEYTRWDVSIPSLGWAINPSFSSNDLLMQAQMALEVLTTHQGKQQPAHAE